jgi:hypothetical protein
MGANEAAKWWMAGSGIAMLAMGVLANVDTSVVGSASDALIRMNAMHGDVHALGGALTLLAAATLSGRRLGAAALAYGALFAFGFVSNLASPDFFGTMPDAPANLGVHLMHATMTAGSLWAAYVTLRPTSRLQLAA